MAEGHRQRLRKRFEEENIDNMPDYLIIEKLLHGVIYRKDTTLVARELIKKFGGIPQIVDAPPSELKKVEGIGDAAVSFIKFVPKFYRRYCVDKWESPQLFNAPNMAAEYLRDRFIGYDEEVLMMLCMDDSCRMIACKTVCEGTADALSINIRKIMNTAIVINSTRVIIAHNHISGNALPSDEDIIATEKIYLALKNIGIRLEDHIIVSDGDYVSLNDSGIFRMFGRE